MEFKDGSAPIGLRMLLRGGGPCLRLDNRMERAAEAVPQGGAKCT